MNPWMLCIASLKPMSSSEKSYIFQGIESEIESFCFNFIYRVKPEKVKKFELKLKSFCTISIQTCELFSGAPGSSSGISMTHRRLGKAE